MSAFPARYYDGRSSRGVEIMVSLEAGARLRLRGGGLDCSHRLADVRITPRLGDTPRAIHLPDGGKCETRDNDAVDALLRAGGRGFGARLLHALESRLPLVGVAVLLTAAAVWATITHGLPYFAERVAASVPSTVEERLGRETLRTLDGSLFAPSELPPAERARVERLFRRLVENLPEAARLRLELRSSERFGANAFALPSGVVLVTDELVSLAADDAELAAVLAHEVGHVHHRHALRSLLQSSLTALLVAAVVGDLTSITALSATLPTWLIESRYSRLFELEADAYAADLLRARGLSPHHLGTMLRRLEARRPGARSPLRGYLASHPATEERIRRLRER